MNRIVHLALKVEDLEATTQFYQEVFGFKEVETKKVRDHTSRHLTDGLGERWALLETSFKYHASCRHTHPSADALLRLMREQRLAVEMKHLQGLPVAEIAQALGRTETAVGGLLRRGLHRLRDMLLQLSRDLRDRGPHP